MNISDDLARYLPHWRCIVCGFRVFDHEINTRDQVCGCGTGEGQWQVINGHLLTWAKEQIGE